MHLRILALALVTLAILPVGFAQSPTPDAFQVAYASNLNIGDSVVNFTNVGTVSGNDPAGDICVNVYTFDRAEELISCCTCQVAPDSLNSLSARVDLLSDGLIAGAVSVGRARRARSAYIGTPGVPTSLVIKLVATFPSLNNAGGYCDAGNGGYPFADTGNGALAPGLRAWLATLQANSSGDYQLTENAFQNADLSPTENVKLTSYCNFIESDGSGFNICNGCQATNSAVGADLTIGKSHVGNFIQGDTGDSYTITVKNVGNGPTDGSIVTVIDTLPAGLTPTGPTGSVSGWSCGIASQTVTCMRSDVLASNNSYPPIPVTVNIASNAASSVTNTATVSGGGDVNVANNSASDPTNIVGADLTIGKSHTGNFTQGDTGDSYTITVKNVGSGPTDGSIVTVLDTLPAGLTPTGPTGSVSGWSCGIASQTVTCTRSDMLASNNSYPSIPVTVNVASNAAPSLTNTATVSGGGDINLTNNSASDPTNIVQVVTITVASNINGPTVEVDNGTPFTGSQTFTWVVTSNHTIASSTPQSGGTGIQYAWLNWSDSGTISHSVTTPSTATTYTANFQTQYLLTTAVSPSGEGTISPSTEYVNANNGVSVGATGNSTYVFTGFSGGLTGITNPQNVNMIGPMTVTANFETGPDLTIAEMYNGSFRQGDVGDTYTITVTNLGQAATSGALQWVDTLPSGLTAIGLSGPSGWTCTVSTLTCSTLNPLAGGGNAVFTLTVNVSANVAPSVTNTVTVSGGGDVHLNNNTTSLITPIIQVADLTITKTHSGSFIEGQSGTYTITVNNVGAGATVGTVTVTDTLPSGLAALSMSGTGWACNTSTLSCTSSSVLGTNASYPVITLMVLVGNAQPIATNTAHVSGGGELNTANDTANDPTTIIQTVQVTVTTSPANLIVTVDGSSIKGPHAFTWKVGDKHTIATSTPQGSLKFQNWSDGGAISHNITVSASTVTYTATFH